MKRLLVVLVLLLTACAGAGSSRDASAPLPPDPAIVQGALDNGLRYYIRRNVSPPGQVAMRLVILGGSMHEREGQEGAAHFLEHMAFRGTRLYPDGEVQRAMQQLGSSLGQDVNATTGSDVTTFILNTPRNDAGAVDTSLRVLQQLVEEANLDPALLEIERGVVLAEERARHTPQSAYYEIQLRSQIGAHPYARPAIGTRAAVQAMDATALRGFYDAYYRPERAILVMVGDVDPQGIIAAIEVQFEAWRGRGVAGADPAPVNEAPASGVRSHVIPGLSDTIVSLQWTAPWSPEPDTVNDYRVLLIDQLGSLAVNQRMQGLLDAAGRPARNVSAASLSRIPGVWNGSFARATGVTDIHGALDLVATANRQAAAHGVAPDELEAAKVVIAARAAQAVEAGNAAASPLLADYIAAEAAAGAVLLSPEDELSLIETLMPAITVAEVNDALRVRFSQPPVVLHLGPEPPPGGEAAFQTAAARVLSAPVAPYAYAAAAPWPYASFGEPGEVVERKEVADLGVTFVTFANGVTLTVKPTRFQQNDVLVRVRFGLGQLGLPREALTAADMGPGLWASGGLGALTQVQQAQTLSGRRVLAAPGTDEDAYVLSNGGGGFTLASELPLQLELMAAMMTDPGLRADGWAQMLAASDRGERAARQSPSSVLSYNLPALLHSGDMRWTYNTAADRAVWTPDEAAAFMRPLITQSPLDLVIVGDVDVEQAIAETARTFGALPPRTIEREPAGLRDVRFPAGTTTPVVLRHEGRADQAALFIGWPTGQGLYTNPRDMRVAQMLAQLVRDRATMHFRSGAGATYSPDLHAAFSRALPQHGYIGVEMEITPDMAADAMEVIEDIAEELTGRAIVAEELSRMTGPYAASTRQSIESDNAWWAGYLAGAHADPSRLDLIRTQVAGYNAITAADLQAAAKRWLKPETALRVFALPAE